MSERNEIETQNRYSALADASAAEARRLLRSAELYRRSSHDLMTLLVNNGTSEEVLDCLERGPLAPVRVPGSKSLRVMSPPTSPGVYAIQCGRFVKIGRSNNIAKRFTELQNAHPQPLRLLAVLSSRPADESEFHARFASLRVRGEWFHLRDGVLKAIHESRRAA